MYYFDILDVFSAVSVEEGRKLADQWRAAFLETSAKENNVRQVEIDRQTER